MLTPSATRAMTPQCFVMDGDCEFTLLGAAPHEDETGWTACFLQVLDGAFGAAGNIYDFYVRVGSAVESPLSSVQFAVPLGTVIREVVIDVSEAPPGEYSVRISHTACNKVEGHLESYGDVRLEWGASGPQQDVVVNVGLTGARRVETPVDVGGVLQYRPAQIVADGIGLITAFESMNLDIQAGWRPVTSPSSSRGDIWINDRPDLVSGAQLLTIDGQISVIGGVDRVKARDGIGVSSAAIIEVSEDILAIESEFGAVNAVIAADVSAGGPSSLKLTSGGDFGGSLSVPGIGASGELNIGGDLSADVLIDGDVEGSVVVGGDLSGAVDIAGTADANIAVGGVLSGSLLVGPGDVDAPPSSGQVAVGSGRRISVGSIAAGATLLLRGDLVGRLRVDGDVAAPLVITGDIADAASPSAIEDIIIDGSIAGGGGGGASGHLCGWRAR